MTQKTLTQHDLRHFSGTEHWYHHTLVRHVLYTDGVRYVAEAGGAHWLLDDIAIYQLEPKVKAQSFQLWKLTVHADQSAVLTCEDGDGNPVLEKTLPFTDFPLDSITFYVTDNVILLPSEY